VISPSLDRSGVTSSRFTKALPSPARGVGVGGWVGGAQARGASASGGGGAAGVSSADRGARSDWQALQLR
jgi:hypothetical protein